jgi:hypothetical protein
MLQLSLKCWNSAFNAWDLRLIKVVVQLGAVKTYVAAVEALRKKERQDETQFTTKIDGFLSFIPRWILMYLLVVFLWILPCVWPNSGFLCCVFLTLRITLLLLLQKCATYLHYLVPKEAGLPNSPSPAHPVLNSSCSINPIEHAPYIPYIPPKSSEDGSATRVCRTVLYPHANKNTFVVFFCAEKEQATHKHSYQITRHTWEKVVE